MPQNQRTLTQPRPDRTQIRIACTITFLLLASATLIQFAGVTPLPELPAFLPVIDTALFVSDLVIAMLLFTQASVFRSRALMALASAYLMTALLAAAHALTFPGAFALTGLLGARVNTSAWLAVFLRCGLGLGVCTYATLKRDDVLRFRRPAIGVVVGIAGAFALATALLLLATRGVNLLPQLMVDHQGTWLYPNVIPIMAVPIVICLTAIAMLAMGRKTRLDVWLMLSVAALFVQFPLVILASQRFTAAWYFAQAAGLVSHLVVMLALIAEASHAYTRLSLSVSAQDRERDARLMSMDAVAAAIAHEVKQPLGAIVTNASAGMHWLHQDPPNIDKAVQSLQVNIEQGHRASDLINSMRSVLARRSGKRTTFSLNDLVRETTPLLDQELANAKISLLLALDESLSPVTVDRLQMQQVLINLFTNAVQSLRGTEGRARRIAVRSAQVDGHDVLIEVADNGIGISADRMEHIFDAFFTSKPSGTGMGLSLCRTIVEKHAGTLWASQNEDLGVTFHLQLPQSDFAIPDFQTQG